MTTLREWDVKTVLEAVRDRDSLELVQRVLQAEATFHESRLSQLRDLNQALEQRLGTLNKGG